MARARVQHRHGTYSQYEDNITGILPEEVVIVDSGHPTTTDGKAMYYKTSQGDPVRVANADEVGSYDDDITRIDAALSTKASVQDVQLSGSSPNPNVDTAIDKDVLYRLFNSAGGREGWLVFCGSANFSNVTVSQIAFLREGNIKYRTGTANSGTVVWSNEWTDISGDFVPTSRTIADIALSDDITAADLYDALGIDNAIKEAIPDISGLMELASSGVPTQQVNQGQAFYTSNTIGIKTSPYGTSGTVTTKQAYDTDYIDTMIGNIETLLSQI